MKKSKQKATRLSRSEYAPAKKGISTGAIVVGSIGVGVVLVGGFFAAKKMGMQLPAMLPQNTETPSPSSPGNSTPRPGGALSLPEGSFPISEGQKSMLVKELQRALIGKGGVIANHINSTGGADGAYGSGTRKALEAAGENTVVDLFTFNRIINSVPKTLAPITTPAPSESTSTTGAADIIKYTNPITAPYYAAEAAYNWLLSGDSALSVLSKFSSPKAGLSAIPVGRDVITIAPTIVRDRDSKNAIVVDSANYILGKEIDRDMVNMTTTVQTIDGKKIIADLIDVKYI